MTHQEFIEAAKQEDEMLKATGGIYTAPISTLSQVVTLIKEGKITLDSAQNRKDES